jgi:hypothetical protein
MCKAKELSEQLIYICDEIEIEMKQIAKDLSKYDLMEQDVLHMIENENFNAAEGYCMAKKLQEIRINRRETKNELAPMQTLITYINANKSKIVNVRDNINLQYYNLNKDCEQKRYCPRVLKEIS